MTAVGGAARGRGRYDSISLRDANGGFPRSDAYREESRLTASLGGLRAPSVRTLFRGLRATPAVLEFLEETRVGRMTGRVLAGGADVEEEGLEDIELWAPEEAGESETSEESEREEGPGPPP